MRPILGEDGELDEDGTLSCLTPLLESFKKDIPNKYPLYIYIYGVYGVDY